MKNIQLALSFFVLALLSLTFSSCMHAVMMGGHGSHDGMESVTTINAVSNGDITLSVTATPMEINKMGTITISLKSKNRIPDTTSVHFMIMKSVTDKEDDAHNHGSDDDSDDFKPIHESVSVINGSASIHYTPTVAGRFILTVETAIDSASLSAELNIPVHKKKEYGMMGMGMFWDYPIIGVLAMGAMMITMWAVRGNF